LIPNGLPRPIPTDELQVMLGLNQAFGSWDASISKVCESMARWPFLFSGHRLLGTRRQTKSDEHA
jgi:hypothetical protein